MKLSTHETAEVCVVSVNESRIDAVVAIQFKDRMRNVTDCSAPCIVLDLGQVDFIDSSGLGAIVAAMKQLGPNRRLDLAALNPNVDKVFRLTRMDSVFRIYDTLEDALAG